MRAVVPAVTPNSTAPTTPVRYTPCASNPTTPCTAISLNPGHRRRSRRMPTRSSPAASRNLQTMSVGVPASGVPRLAPMKPELHITTKPASVRWRRLPIPALMKVPRSIRVVVSSN